MPLIFRASSRAAAEDVSRRLRSDGFLARASCRGSAALVIVNCIRSEYDTVKQRAQRIDPTARLLAA